jgi:hypothetical protein
MGSLLDMEMEPFLVFGFPEYRDDASYIMLSSEAIEALWAARGSIKGPVGSVLVEVPYIELLDLWIIDDANVKLGKDIGVITAWRLWDYGVDEEADLQRKFTTGACSSFDSIRLELTKSSDGYEFRAVGFGDYESMKGGAYERTVWVPLEKLSDAAAKVAKQAREKENFSEEE